jgi:inhibitor of cysteine peptidase
MESKIKKRAQIYGIAAILLAIILGTLCYNFGVYPPESESPEQLSPSAGPLSTFSSYEELRSFLTTNSRTQGTFVFLGPWDFSISEDVRMYLAPLGGEIVTAPGLSAAPTQDLEFKYSITNIQVAGVDEADIVKTDGEYIYITSGHSVFILKAYPPKEAEVLSKITLNDTYPAEIFVGPSSNRLAVLGCKHNIPLWRAYGQYFVDIKTFVNVYDISNKTNPTLLTNFKLSGSYFNSRMIGEYVYFVVSQPAYVIYDTVVLPKIYSSDGIKEISASEIHYSNASDNYYMYTTIVALNMQNTEEKPTHMTLMLGGTSSMYVSLNNVYITFPETAGKTSIYRIRIENSTLNCEAHGQVLGRELNQFSMDEYDNYFRIATTTSVNGNTQNNVYILNMNLSIVGNLTNIAPGEAIDSARFIGNRCYLATSIVQKDPFFVIDVENASDPKILGYLKIPGFTRYLHPYNEDHVIGIGKEGSNVKISLFDVSNVSDPIEIDNYKIEGDWSDTPVLTEHKAFLFDRSKELLVIPLSISDWDKGASWQGAYVFNITLSGLVLRGNVTHQENDVGGWESGYYVKRALYIEDILYTMSDKKIKMNNLEDLVFLNEIELP